jgi:DNA polymerase-3 subunit epsilon
MTHEEPGLFDLPGAVPTSAGIEDPLISPEQIASIRNAFDAAGIAAWPNARRSFRAA